ncbi:MAG: hypothetical protein RI101_11175 [Nitrospira sp.]|jgi:hypothetical protein|nr:hypothetical protein [Nitrospira sp.]
MRWFHVLLVLLLATAWTACSSTRWVHPTKKEEFLTYDWNQCERDWLNLMATNPGIAGMADNQALTRQRIDRCLQKKGWRKIEEE